MSATQTANPTTAPETPAKGFSPEDYRMTIGEHLEELRNRLFKGAAGFFVAFVVAMIFGDKVVYFLCRPLLIALARNDLSATIYFTDPAEVFMTYIKCAMICAGAAAGPWILYQIWQFVAAGLYPKERKYVTKYLPLSIFLLVAGMVFLYVYVLPLMLQFFIAFPIGKHMPVGRDVMNLKPNVVATQPVTLPMVAEDPKEAVPGQVWLNVTTGLVKIAIAPGKYRVISFGSEGVTSPMITLKIYFDMIIGLLLAFGLAFQLPLVVLALVKIGIVRIEQLKALRRIVYFSLSIIAAIIVPDVVTGMVALLVPLILLYELGILMAWYTSRDTVKEEEAGSGDA